MTYDELKEFVEEGLLDGDTLNETYFDALLAAAQQKIEGERDWKILEKTDTSKTVSTSDTFLTTKALPTDFAEDRGLYLVNGQNHAMTYAPVPYAQRYIRKDASRRYYIDLANGVFALTGLAPAGFSTIHLVYKSFSPTIDDSQEWVFPSRFHPILGFLVAEMVKGGSDYDDISAKQLIQHRVDARVLYDSMEQWDANLRLREANHSYEEQGQYDSDGLPSGDAPGFPLSVM